MISINYKINVINPVKNKLKPSGDMQNKSTIKLKRLPNMYCITGYFNNGTDTKQTSNYYKLGDTYSVTPSKSITPIDDQFIVDVIDVLSLNNTLFTDIPNKLRNKIKKTNKLKDDYVLEDIVENKNDIVLFEILPNGIMSRIKIDIDAYSNRFKYDTKNIIVYFKVSKTLKVDLLSNSFTIHNKDLLTLPQGFCTLYVKVPNNRQTFYQIDDKYYLLKAISDSTYTSSYPILIDGIKTNSYVANKNENLLISLLEDSVPLNTIDLNTDDNITAIYRVSDSGEEEPYLLYCDQKTLELLGLDPVSYNFKIRQKTLTSSDENKKRYTVRQYKIKLKNNNNFLEFLDNDFYKNLIYNAMQFNKKVIVND